MRAARWLVGGVAIVISMAACGSVRISKSYGIGNQVVLGSGEGWPPGEAPLDVPLNFNLLAETGPITTGPASHVYLDSFTLEVTDDDEPEGDEDDFGFVDGIEVFLASSREDSELPRIRVAHFGDVGDGERRMSLDVTDEDLLPYLREGISLNVIATGVTPPDDVSYTGRFQVVILM